MEFNAESKNQLGNHIKTLQSDQGGEYMSTPFDSILKEYEIISQLNAQRTS